jgi:hypothetical protein
MIEPAATPGMDDQDPEQWFVTNGEWRLGPLAIEDVVDVLGRGHPPGSVHVWKAGQENWLPAELVPEVVAARAGEPVPRFGGGAAPTMVQAAGPQTSWFLVGTGKLVLMWLGTLGLYAIYWFYQQWRHVQLRGESVRPALRTIFAGIFCYALFRRIATAATERQLAGVVSPVACAVAYIALSMAVRLPQPWALVSLLAVVPLVVVQRMASAVALAEVPTADPNTRLSPLNWVAVGFGGLLLFLTLLGMALGPGPDAPKPGTTSPPAQVRAI